MKIIKSLIVLISLLLPYPAFCESIVFIGNFAEEIKMSAEEIKKIYLENGMRISGGKFIQPLDYHEENELRDEFYKKMLEKNRAQMKSYWARRIFTGKGTPPKSFASLKEARDFLKNNSSNFIIYLKESSLEKGDRVVFKITDTSSQ